MISSNAPEKLAPYRRACLRPQTGECKTLKRVLFFHTMPSALHLTPVYTGG